MQLTRYLFDPSGLVIRGGGHYEKDQEEDGEVGGGVVIAPYGLLTRVADPGGVDLDPSILV